MVSSLAAQLAKGASLNTTLLVYRSHRKAAESYLFTGCEADTNMTWNPFTRLGQRLSSIHHLESGLPRIRGSFVFRWISRYRPHPSLSRRYHIA
ncbi:hypothetical protein B0H14DRAFT_1119928 [Mycena olivaceomarginata]|nr:hypothetical protein B0H14DRAFT_1119928 [Mycena olivaceomarginata]